MDCKRSYKYSTLRQLLSLICILTMMSCSWVKDDYDDCPYGFWLKLNYTYNILDVEAAPKYVKDAFVYIYDADGKYVNRVYASYGDLTANNYRVRIDGLPEGYYQFVVWCGIDNQFAVSGENQTIDDFRLTLLTNGDGNSYNGKLPDLFYGYLSDTYFDDSYAIHDVDLMKNTNQFSCLIVSIDNSAVMDPYDYDMKIISANGTMNAYNQLVSNVAISYEPNQKGSVVFNDTEYGNLQGIQFSIPSLRLMNESSDRIVLEKKDNGQKLFDISLSEYIGMIGQLYSTLGHEVSIQNYLDRQDYYTVVFYLSDDLERLISLKVNNWQLRSDNHIKL